MDRQTFVFLGAGILLLSLSFGMIAYTRVQAKADAALVREAREERESAAPLVDPRQLAQAEDQEPPPAASSARQRVGMFRIETATGGETNHAEIIDPAGNTALIVEAYAFSSLHEKPTVFGHALLEVVEKGCAEPCNPTSHVVALRDRDGAKIFSGPGTVKIVDLDRDGTAWILLEHLLEGTRDERITLPFRLEDGRFVKGHDRHPELIEEQEGRLRKAAEEDCGRLSKECESALRGLMALELFKGIPDLAPLISSLKIQEPARRAAMELILPLDDEVQHLDGNQ